MSMRICLWALAGLVLLGSVTRAESPKITWKKSVLDKQFRSEGVAVADVNKDGKNDILVGDYWYEAPDWTKHEIRKPGNFADGAGGYSKCFACWADDIDGDSWQDLVLVGFPGEPALWYKNPGKKEGHWPEYFICKSACNESPQYADLHGKGRRSLVMGYIEKEMVWVAPGKDPTQPWEIHYISKQGEKAPGTDRYWHGLGVADINADGRADVLCTSGWWEQPSNDDGKTPWAFHAVNLGDRCADMYTYDVNGDGKVNVLSSSAHNFGIWVHLQGSDGPKGPFVKQTLFPKIFSQSHAMHCIDINGDGLKDLVTGKRRWAHGPKGDDEPMASPVLFWFEAQKSPEGIIKFVPHQIDDSSGIGTQFWVGDYNGDKLTDVAVSNKMGVYLFEQVREK